MIVWCPCFQVSIALNNEIDDIGTEAGVQGWSIGV